MLLTDFFLLSCAASKAALAQAGVYELMRDDGTVDKVKVLKAKHKYALMTKMQREWEVGRRISSLKHPDRAMPGYMSVGSAVCTETGNFKGKFVVMWSFHHNACRSFTVLKSILPTHVKAVPGICALHAGLLTPQKHFGPLS